jgi:hypothetical protein
MSKFHAFKIHSVQSISILPQFSRLAEITYSFMFNFVPPKAGVKLVKASHVNICLEKILTLTCTFPASARLLRAKTDLHDKVFKLRISRLSHKEQVYLGCQKKIQIQHYK